MAADSISGGNKFHTRGVRYQEKIVAFKCNIILYFIEIIKLYCKVCPACMSNGYKLVRTQSHKIQLSSLSFASALHCLQPSEVDYNYILHTMHISYPPETATLRHINAEITICFQYAPD